MTDRPPPPPPPTPTSSSRMAEGMARAGGGHLVVEKKIWFSLGAGVETKNENLRLTIVTKYFDYWSAVKYCQVHCGHGGML